MNQTGSPLQPSLPLASPLGVRRTLRPRQRLTHSSLFRETYAQGVRFVGKTMVLWLRSSDDTAMRLGVVASRKVGNAVKRARARRRLREAFRRNRHLLSGPHDVVLVARRALLDAPWQDIVSELLTLAAQAGLMQKSKPE